MNAKILLVDDDPEAIFLLKELFYEEDLKIFSAANGWLGFMQAKKVKPDLIISDLQMPIINGYEFLVKVRQDLSLAKTPFILLSSYRNEEHRNRAFHLGASAYLTKPVNFDFLLKIIEQELAGEKLCETVGLIANIF
ncbi:MAG: response regulator [Oscillatoria sp. PMC 1068.18]|nr:response regulator [Oscillatoria sp. PMC 1076.18]MEC4991200.1 response regulator [Oscillatoria sp. PMC 1068.18]